MIRPTEGAVVVDYQEDDSPLPMQDEFLRNLRDSDTPVCVFLVSGIRLTGSILAFDKFSLVLGSSMGNQLVYKHAISTISRDAKMDGSSIGNK